MNKNKTIKMFTEAAVERVNNAAIELLIAESVLMETPITRKEAKRFFSELLDISHTIVHDVIDAREVLIDG